MIRLAGFMCALMLGAWLAQTHPDAVHRVEKSVREAASQLVVETPTGPSTDPQTTPAQSTQAQTTPAQSTARENQPSSAPEPASWAVWAPFNTRVSAQGFVDQLQALTGVQFRIAAAQGRYQIWYDYQQAEHLAALQGRLGELGYAIGVQASDTVLQQAALHHPADQ